MAQKASISPSITPSESVSSIGALARSIETLSILLPPPAHNPNVVHVEGKTYRRNFLVRIKRPRTGWYWKDGTEWDEEIGEEEVDQCWVCRHCESFHPIRATGGHHIKLHLKKKHQIIDDDNDIILIPEADSSTPILFNCSISDKTELK